MSAAPQMSEGNDAKLSTEKISDGAITCVRFSGMIDESFDGQRLAGGIRAKTLILDAGRISKISSFGIREWSNFVKGVERSVESIYIIECAPKVVDQINMVAGFVGKAKVYSFYGPYRCDYCDIDKDVLFQMDRDAQDVAALKPREEACESCGRDMYFDEDPSTFFSYVANQPSFVIPPDVADFLATKLDYNVTGADRHLQIDKSIEGRYTYLRLNGNLDGTFPSEKLAEGLEGIVVVDVAGLVNIDMAGAAEWRNFVTMARSGADEVILTDCPPVLLDRLSRPEDLGDKVLSFTMPYSCSKCSTTSSQLIDVDEHHDILRFATPPEMKCGTCKEPTICLAPESLLSRLRSLPKPDVDSSLRSFIKAAKKRKPERQAAPEEPSQVSSGKIAVLATAAFVAVAAAGVALVFNYYQNKELKESIADKPAGTAGGPSRDDRPEWITSDTPNFASCSDLISRVTCVGVSPYVADKDEGRQLAREAALDELVNVLSVKIESPVFEQRVRPLYTEARRKGLLAFDSVRGDRRSEAHKKAAARLASARRRVAEAALATGGTAIPLQQSAGYWEEYEGEAGASDYLVFVRYDISLDAVRRLAAIYTKEISVEGGKAITAFPALAWAYDDFQGGVIVTESSRKLERLGAEDSSVVASVGDTGVVTAEAFAEEIQSAEPDSLVPLTPIAGAGPAEGEVAEGDDDTSDTGGGEASDDEG